ncbi:MAG: ATP-grasp domain-containing protein [Pyrodictiaceae archaeon]
MSKPVTVLVTGSGSSATSSTIYSLKMNPESRKVRIVCTDIRPGIAARFMCDSFYIIPRASSPDFLDAVTRIIEEESIDVVLPQVPAELPVLARERDRLRRAGAVVAISPPEAIAVALDKYRMIEYARSIGVPAPQAYSVSSWSELEWAIEELGYPAKPFIVRIGSGDGMKGFRIVVSPEKAWEWFSRERPGGPPWITISALRDILGQGSFKTRVMVAEYLPGEEYTVDVLADSNKVYVVVPRRRLEMRISMTFSGIVEEREDVIKYSEKLSKSLGLEYAFGFQFREDEDGIPKLLECNPRIQSTMILSAFAGANVVWGAVKLALGEEPGPFNVKWGTILYRFWGAIGVYEDRLIASDWLFHYRELSKKASKGLEE